jgi:hypothetical protein
VAYHSYGYTTDVHRCGGAAGACERATAPADSPSLIALAAHPRAPLADARPRYTPSSFTRTGAIPGASSGNPSCMRPSRVSSRSRWAGVLWLQYVDMSRQ